MEENTVIYRQFFTDRALIHKASYDENRGMYGINTQFKLYYQFLKHQFPLQKLPQNTSIKFFLDNHTAQKSKEKLTHFLIKNWEPRHHVRIEYVQSRKKNHIQLIDLIIGMSGFRGNKIFFKTHGSIKKKKIKQKFSKDVYDKMRKVDNYWRGSQVFNLFNSTSQFAYKDNPLLQKLSVWKFEPQEYYRDKGWENDHLSSKGEYQGEDIHYRCEETNRWKKKE